MKRFKKFASKQFKALKKHLKAFTESHDKELLHEVRVDIKKIKAMIQVIDDSEKKFKAHKQFLPFRNIFRKADAIRQSAVLASLLEKYPEEARITPPPAQGSPEIFESQVDDYLQTVKRRAKKLKSHVREVHSPDVDHYIKRHNKNIADRLYPRVALKDIHKTRKAIKATLYIADATDRLKKKRRKFYESIEEAIGTLHDKQQLLQFLQKHDGHQKHAALRTACAHDIRHIRSLVNEFYR